VVFAQSSSSSAIPEASPSSSIEDKDVKDLKERLANKVAEIRKKDQKAISGFSILKDGAIFIKDTRDDLQYKVEIDGSLTKLYQILGATKREVKSEDIKKDMYLIVTGPVIDKTINANYVFIDESFIVQAGKVTEVNSTDYYITLTGYDKEQYSIDIESATKQNMLNIKTLEIEKTGFSKIKEGDTVHFVAKKDNVSPSSDTRLAATKILIIPQEYFIK